MRLTKLIVTALVVTGLAAAASPALAANGGPGGAPQAGTLAVTPLSESEIATLQWMREEEKLARDMYLTLNIYFPAQIFTRIATSEQNHFDAIGRKLVLYGVDDPAQEAVGVFTDPDLQTLYDDLLAAGMVNYVEALKVGVAVEESDMADLEAAIVGTDNVSLARTYGHLLAASGRHLAAFTKLLAKEGVVLE